MTRADAIKTIREALEDARDAINTNYTNCSMNYYADQCDTALAALDSLTIEPSEDAVRFAQVMADHFNDSDNPYKKEWVNKAATIITERDKRIRVEVFGDAEELIRYMKSESEAEE